MGKQNNRGIYRILPGVVGVCKVEKRQRLNGEPDQTVSMIRRGGFGIKRPSGKVTPEV